MPCGTNIEKKKNLMDCIALDSGYSLYVEPVIYVSDLNNSKFVYPIGKDCRIYSNNFLNVL